ncbi:hypothetical protein MASR2M18_00750 [Ignavibacteria bacterium]|nr:hypothetical protein [Bacteroidota bacterium]MCZ2133100.1 glycoside hydrolase family 3 protein [Bacteroidota bacterium]
MSVPGYRLLAASCLFPALRQLRYAAEPTYRDDILRLVEEDVRGFCIFQGDAQETAELIAELNSHAKKRLLFCADFEHGLPMRLDGGTAFPHAMALGRANNTEYTREAARIIAREMKALGVDWNFAPVCDVNSNPQNPIINIRSFGETPDTVARHASAFIEGLQTEGIIACAKHFPGHGDTAIDSHLDLPALSCNRTHLEQIELAPFRAAVAVGSRSIMIGHLAIPALENAKIPASLSPRIITDILRNELGFEGLIVTDALEMQAITRSYSSGEAATAAIRAGADAVLIPENPLEALNALETEARRDDKFAELLQKAADRITLHQTWAQAITTSAAPLHATKSAEFALKIAKAAINISDEKRILPISNFNSFAALAYCPDDNLDPATEFFRYLAQTLENDCDFCYIDDTISDEDAQILATEIADVDVIIIGFFVRSRAYRGNVALGENLMPRIRTIIGEKPFVGVIFGSPYIADAIQSDCTVFCYSDASAAIGAAALAVSGKLSATD